MIKTNTHIKMSCTTGDYQIVSDKSITLQKLC